VVSQDFINDFIAAAKMKMRRRKGRLKPSLKGIEGFARTGTPGSTLARCLPCCLPLYLD
jgi:hypothetical protein